MVKGDGWYQAPAERGAERARPQPEQSSCEDDQSAEGMDLTNLLNDLTEKKKSQETEVSAIRSEAILVKTGRADVVMTNALGEVLLQGPHWDALPLLMGSCFFLDGNTVWSMDGVKHDDWIIGRLILFINNWILQSVNDVLYLSRVEYAGGGFENGVHTVVDQLGYANFEYVIVYKDGAWRKYIYSKGYWSLDCYQLDATTDRELRIMSDEGANPALIGAIYEAQGNAVTFRPNAVNTKSLYQTMTSKYFKLAKLCLTEESVEVISNQEHIPLQIVYGVKHSVGKRTVFCLTDTSI